MTGLSSLLAIETDTLDAQISVTADTDEASASLGDTDVLALLGEVGELIAKIEEIGTSPDAIAGAVREGLDVLAALAPFVDIEELEEALTVLAAVRERLEPLREMSGLDPAAIMDRALFEQGGLGSIIQNLSGEVANAFNAEVPEALEAPIAALRELSGGPPASAQELAAFVSRFMVGLDLEALRQPFELMIGVKVEIEASGGDLAWLEDRIGLLTQRVTTAADELVSRNPDMAAIARDLNDLRGDINTLFQTDLPGAIDRMTGDIAALDIEGKVASIDQSLAPLVNRVPVPPRGIEDLFLPPLRSLGQELDELTADTFVSVLTSVEEEIRAVFEASGVGRLREDLRTLMSGLVAFMRQLPMRSLRLRLTQALLSVQDEIAKLADFSPVAALGEELSQLASAIDEIDLDAVRSNVEALKTQLEEAVGTFSIEDVRAQLDQLIGEANSAVSEVPEALQELDAAIDTLCDEIRNIDLSGPGEQGAGIVRELRGNVETALDQVDLPDAVKVPIGVLAGQVREIDISASLDGELGELVAQVNVAGALEPVQRAINEAREALLRLSPTAVVLKLDEPFDQLLAASEQISPEALVGRLSGAFEKATGQLDRLDPVSLVEPLQGEFDDAVAQMREAVDPAPLLVPLHSAYDELQGILDAVDPQRLFGAISGQIAKLPSTLSTTTAGMLEDAVSEGTGLVVSGDNDPLQFGDILRPFALLIAEARRVLHRGADEVIEEGLELVSAPLAMLNRAGRVAGSHMSQIGQAVEGRRGIVDPFAKNGPLPELYEALDRLRRIEAGLSAGGRATAELSTSVANVQIDLHITANLPERQRLSDTIAQLDRGLNAPALGRSFQSLGQVLSSFVPAHLLLPETQGAIHDRLDALFDLIDPTEIADEMDEIGARLQAKLATFAEELGVALFKIIDRLFTEVQPVTPAALIKTLSDALDAVKAELSVLDPAQLEEELDAVLDAVVAALDAYSPAAFAGTLTSSFDAIKVKLSELDPAALLGDLSPLSEALDQLRALRPSEVLAPLIVQAEAIDEALENILDLDPVVLVEDAIANLKLQIEQVLEKIEAEIDELLLYLERAGGGSGSVSASASVG